LKKYKTASIASKNISSIIYIMFYRGMNDSQHAVDKKKIINIQAFNTKNVY